MKFAFIATRRGIWLAGWLCEALGISRASFYAWRTRPRVPDAGRRAVADPAGQLPYERSHLWRAAGLARLARGGPRLRPPPH